MLLNNLCECLNKQLVDARDKPIIACVDFIREYLMKRIVVVQKVIEKSNGPLTPAATKLMQLIKKEAAECKVIWNGGVKYQVSAPWGDQCVVNVEHMVCSCRKWELSGLPCKHAVATNWDMTKNQLQVGIPETWANQCYWLETWKNAYSYKVNPVTGTSTWPKSKCPLGMTPPIHHNPVGRPKKKRRRGLYEDDNVVKDGKLCRKFYGGKCAKCGNRGHNSRTCKGQTSDAGGNSQGNNEGVDGGRSEAGSEGRSEADGSQPIHATQESAFVSEGRSDAGGSQPGGSSQGRSQPGGSSQGSQESQPGGSRRMGKKVVSKVRGKSQRILRHRLAKVTSGPGLTPEDAMEVD